MVKFENININDLNPSEYNPRIMKPSEQLKLKRNLETFGLIDPILVDLTDNMTVIGGHQRLQVLKEIDEDTELKLLRLGDLGLVFKETNIKIKDKNDQKAMNLSLNKITGEWDFNKVDNVLIGLHEDNYLLELTGFDLDEITLEPLGEDYLENEQKILENIEEQIQYETPEETKERQQKYKEKQENEEDTLSKKQKFLKIEVIFETEEEMTKAFDELVKKGYNCRMSGV